eukprot:8577683-Lingulodinium_polyedra.AAC.1
MSTARGTSMVPRGFMTSCDLCWPSSLQDMLVMHRPMPCRLWCVCPDVALRLCRTVLVACL